MKKIKKPNVRKRIILPTMLALSILVIGVLATNVRADEVNNYPPIVAKIAERFNLNVTDVQSVFDEERDERRAEMYARFSEYLDELVSSGKITVNQKDTILAKHEELQNQIDELRSLPAEQRREKMKSLHDDFKNWLNDQGLQNLNIGSFGHGFRMGHMGMMGGN